jgi:hypothetical protein
MPPAPDSRPRILPAMNAPRRPACARCGAAFDCAPHGDCWCKAERYRLPLPQADGAECLCPTCLRFLAAERTVSEVSR